MQVTKDVTFQQIGMTFRQQKRNMTTNGHGVVTPQASMKVFQHVASMRASRRYKKNFQHNKVNSFEFIWTKVTIFCGR